MSDVSARRRWSALAVCCLAQLLITLDLTVLHLAVPKLLEDLRPTATEFLWITDIYGFTLAGFLVTMGNLGDRIGRKKLLLIGSTVFGAASLATAFAPNVELLITARALLGVSAATLMPSTLSIVRNVFTDAKQRTMAIGLWSGVAILGIGFGPVIAGFLLSYFWWGSVFLVNVPVVAVLVLAGAFVLPESRNPKPGRLDAGSVVLSIAGMIAIVYTIKEIAHRGFGHADVLIAAIAGVTALALFVRRQRHLAEPLIDVKLFRQRAFSATVGVTLVAMFVQLATSLATAQYFQLVLGWSPIRSGLAGLPGMAGALAGGALCGLVVSKIGRAATVAIGCALSAAGFLGLAQVGVDTGYPYVAAVMVVFGAGVASTLTVATDTVLGAVPKERAGAASAISETANELGAALGIAILGSVLTAVYRSRLDLPGFPDSAKETLGSTVAFAQQLPAAGPVIRHAQEAFMTGLQTTMYVSAGLLAVLGVVALIGLRGVPKVIEEPEPVAA
ncbi:MFS transporter [Amycolatopsis sp. CA-230715]|uniref:MFS transporter n=1 Tax=Amycolatopsis sp. CA-230715 TaxID=2745196 RepID=UPI001C009C95|nr:MFS transporter [Amycolatopsis sp. CA-230715]QWF80229.1 Antiseptic resistance protein [Amycolatopsis sp. CA-230715]